MIPLIPVLIFIVIQATAGAHYEKTHGYGADREPRITSQR